VFANRDYEPQAIARDADVAERLRVLGIAFELQGSGDLREERGAHQEFNAVLGVHALQAGLAGGADAVSPQGLSGRQIRRRPRRAGADERVPSLAEIGFEPTNLGELGIACGMAGGRAGR
jgi:deoxyribodipyrimidine photo-lyase